MKDDKLTATLSEWFVLSIEDDIKELLALHKRDYDLEKDLIRKHYEPDDPDPEIVNSPNYHEWMRLQSENIDRERKAARYSNRYVWMLYLFSRSIQSCLTKNQAYDQEGWLNSVKTNLASLEKTSFVQ